MPVDTKSRIQRRNDDDLPDFGHAHPSARVNRAAAVAIFRLGGAMPN